MLNLSEIKKIHFLGLGGVSMSSLARFFHAKGYEVSGTDRDYSDTLIALSEEGIRAWSGFEPTLTARPDLAVYSSALPENDPELIYLRGAEVPVLERMAFLPYVADLFKYTVGIAGTHGKTTVTSMCAVIMREAGLSFYAHIGGTGNDLGSFYYSGDDYFLSEACEYKRSMLCLKPTCAVVLNAEVDHPDTYRDQSDVYDAFDDFLSSPIKIVNGDTEYYGIRQKHTNAITFGYSVDCFYRGIEVTQLNNACFGCQILKLGSPLCRINLRVPGKHNLTDALAAAGICSSIGISGDIIARGLNGYSGVKRRFEYVGKFLSCDVYTDYAHHPTEISEGLKTARLITRNHITLVFQPHTYSRTARLKKEFISALSKCDKLIVVKEYAAREKPSDGLSALNLFRECINGEKYYAANLIEAGVILHNKTAPDDLILIMGAGDVVNLGKIIAECNE